MYVAREETLGVEATAARFKMRTTCLLVASLGVPQDRGDALQVGEPVFHVNRKGGDQRIGRRGGA